MHTRGKRMQARVPHVTLISQTGKQCHGCSHQSGNLMASYPARIRTHNHGSGVGAPLWAGPCLDTLSSPCRWRLCQQYQCGMYVYLQAHQPVQPCCSSAGRSLTVHRHQCCSQQQHLGGGSPLPEGNLAGSSTDFDQEAHTLPRASRSPLLPSH